jgi:hypothetical protein
MSKNREFAEEKPVFENGKVYVNLKNVALIQVVADHSIVTLANGNDHKFKTAQLVILE